MHMSGKAPSEGYLSDCGKGYAIFSFDPAGLLHTRLLNGSELQLRKDCHAQLP